MACTPKQMTAAIIRNLPSKTGKSIVQWIELLNDTSIQDKKEAIAYLKSQGLGHIQAQTVYSQKAGGLDYHKLSADDLFKETAEMELYKYLYAKITALNPDIRVEPCKTYIPFYRKNQFAIVAPAGKQQIKLGLTLPKEYQHPNFDEADSFGTKRVTKKVKLSNKEEVNNIIEAIKLAYELN